MKHKKTLLASLLASVLGASVTGTAVAATYEFDSFKDVDVDRSGYMEDGEFRSYAFGQADWDNDGYLEKTEWAQYTEVYYDTWDLDYDSFEYYDADGDGLIDRVEFSEMPTANLYSAWDNDNDKLITDKDWDNVAAYYQDKK